MTNLALKINGTEYPVPTDIQHIVNKTGPFGQGIIQWLISLSLAILILVSLVFLIRGGIAWMMSEGDKAELQKARSSITWAIVGLAVAFLSFLIINVIGYFFETTLIGH